MKLFTHGNLFVVLVLLSLPFSAHAAEKNNRTVENAALSQLMQALSQNDFEGFISNGSPQFKRGITKSAFNSVVKQLGNLIQSGYKAEYLAELNQQGNKVHLWKISYKKNNEHTLAKLVLVENKVAGFWLQ